jgi:hypothetical protein
MAHGTARPIVLQRSQRSASPEAGAPLDRYRNAGTQLMVASRRRSSRATSAFVGSTRRRQSRNGFAGVTITADRLVLTIRPSSAFRRTAVVVLTGGRLQSDGMPEPNRIALTGNAGRHRRNVLGTIAPQDLAANDRPRLAESEPCPGLISFKSSRTFQGVHCFIPVSPCDDNLGICFRRFRISRS